MSKILISLISEETIPNVLLISELNNIEKYIFISTQKNINIENWIIQATMISKDKILNNIIVNENDLCDIEQKLSLLDFNDLDELFVNITAGNKIMTLVCHDFFKELGAKIFYVDSFSNKIIKVFPKAKNRFIDIKTSLNVKQYLQSYGFECQNEGKISQKKEVTQKTFNFFVPFFEPGKEKSVYADLITELQRFRSKKKMKISEINGLSEMLSQMQFETVTPEELNKEEIIYLTGGWFEEYVYNKIKAELNLTDEHITTGFSVEKYGVPNEFDVVFCYKNKIYTIECKTSVYYYENEKKRTTIGDFVYKCDSLQSELGLYPVAAIATLSALRDQNGKINQIAQTHCKRAELYNVKIMAFAELTSGKSFREMLGIK